MFHTVCIKENRNAVSCTRDCQTFFVKHISTKKGNHVNSPVVCMLLWEEKKLQTGSSLVLRSSLQRNICFQASSKMTGRMSGHIPTVTQWSSLSGLENMLSMGCLKHICIQTIPIIFQNCIKQCQIIH